MDQTEGFPKYRRVLLKVSGEFLSNENGFGISPARVKMLAQDIAELIQAQIQVAVVIGAGNICRGNQLVAGGGDQVASDHMGMIATIINALALNQAINKLNVSSHVRSALSIESIVRPYERDEACDLLDAGCVLISAGGTGNPLVTTDTAAALRAIELKADVLLKATKVDGVYSADPEKDLQATLYSELSFQQVLERQLRVMDLSAICLCRDHGMPVMVFNMDTPKIINQIINGQAHGTLIHSGEEKCKSS
jgi:uridylate kinase